MLTNCVLTSFKCRFPFFWNMELISRLFENILLRIICFPASTPPLIWENKINPRGQWYNHDYNEMSHQDAHFNFSAPLVSVIFDFFALNYWWMNCRVNPDMKFKSKVTKIIKFLEFFIALFKLGLSCSAVNSQGGPSRGLLLFFTS